MEDRESRTDYPPAYTDFIEELAKQPLSLSQMATTFNEKFNTNWSRSKIGSLCYRRGWRVREERPIKYLKVPLNQPGIVSGRVEFRAPPQQLPKIQPPTNRRSDNRFPKIGLASPPTPKPTLRPKVEARPKHSFPPKPSRVLATQPQPSLNLTIDEMAYSGQCKFPTTSFDVKASEHRFCGNKAEGIYCDAHESLCHVETKGLRRKA